jgi:tape measure domain-containing protein
MSDETVKLKLELETQISAQMEKVSKDLEKRFGEIQKNTQAISTGFNGATQSFGKLVAGMAGGTIIAGVISKIKDSAIGLVGALLKQNSSLEQSKVAFGVMLGSAEKADTLLRKLYKFAAETPFESEELLKASKALLAFGSTAESIPEELKSIGDIASAINAPIGEIAELYGKARVQGRLFAQDVNQLTGRGIPIIQEFAKQLGVSESKVKSMVEEGRISFGNLEQAFHDLTSEGGKFKGMMEAQSKTFSGMASTLKDNFSQMLIQVGSGGVFDVLTQNLKKANEWINANQIAIGNMSRAIGAKLGQAVQFAVGHFEDLVLVGKVLLAVFAIQKLVGIATAIRGIGLALTGLTATNPILMAIAVVLGTASFAFIQARDSAKKFNDEAENIKEGEKQLAQYNSTLQKVAALHKTAASGPNPFGGIQAPKGTVDPNTLDPSQRARYDSALGSTTTETGKGPSKPNKLALSEDELKKQAKQLQDTQDKLRESQIQGQADGYDKELAALEEKHKREQRELAGNYNALKALDEAHKQDKANLDDKYEELEFEVQAKGNEKKREDKYALAVKEQKIRKDVANEEERDAARKQELDELRSSQAWDTAGNLIGASQLLFTKNKENSVLLKTLAIGEIAINTSRAVMATLAKGGFWAIPLAISVGALGAAQALKVSQTHYETGGPVIGARHRNGGVDANLEGGEFVLSRNDVRNLGGFSGVETMRKGNSQRSLSIGAYSPTIVIQGNADERMVRRVVEDSGKDFNRRVAQAIRDNSYEGRKV